MLRIKLLTDGGAMKPHDATAGAAELIAEISPSLVLFFPQS